MPPKLDAKSASERWHFVAPASLKQRVEDWRARQRPIPSFGQAVRQLLEERLDQLDAPAGESTGATTADQV